MELFYLLTWIEEKVECYFIHGFWFMSRTEICEIFLTKTKQMKMVGTTTNVRGDGRTHKTYSSLSFGEN